MRVLLPRCWEVREGPHEIHRGRVSRLQGAARGDGGGGEVRGGGRGGAGEGKGPLNDLGVVCCHLTRKNPKRDWTEAETLGS